MPPSVRHATTSLLALALLAALLVPTAPPAAASTASPTAIEVRVAELINSARSQAGLRGLRTDVRVVASAREWSAGMAARGALAHDAGLKAALPGGVTAWAENVAVTSAGDHVADALHKLLMGSSGHRRNILNSRYTDIGVGIAVRGGRTYMTQRFTAGAPARVAPAVTGIAGLGRSVFSGGASHAVIARDDVFADALAAGPLAGAGGPLLFTPPGPVTHPVVRTTLERILPRGRTVWLVGGTGAVSAGVERELSAAGWTVRRVRGSNRLQTAEAVARQVAARDGRPATAVVATAFDWPDAIAGGAYGARRREPVVLTTGNAVSTETSRVLRDLRPSRVAVLGGSAAVTDGVVRNLGATRVAGSTRQGTAAETARRLWGYTDATPSRWIAAPAFGDDAWTWALGAAPLAARSGAAVLLVGPTLSGEVTSYIGSLGYGGSRTATLTTVGPVPAGPAGELRALLR